MSAVDDFADEGAGLDTPARGGAAVTPNDAADLAKVTRAIYVGGTGDVALVMQSGDALTFLAVPGGTLLPIRATRVKATGTTATEMVALW